MKYLQIYILILVIIILLLCLHNKNNIGIVETFEENNWTDKTNICSTLNNKLLSNKTLNKPIICIFLTGKYCDETRNLLYTIKKYEDIGTVAVYCLDNNAYNCMKKEGISHLCNINTDLLDSSFGSAMFHKIVQYKLLMIYDLLQYNRDVLYIDTDIILQKNVTKYLSNIDADIIFQCDSNTLDSKTCSNKYCSGFIYIKTSKLTINVFKDINDSYHTKILKTDGIWDGLGDQLTINQIISKWVQSNDNNIKVHALDLKLFPNGAIYFGTNNNDSLLTTTEKGNAFIIHNNWIKGLVNKIQRFKDNNLWFI
jgi:hypothetical protein